MTVALPLKLLWLLRSIYDSSFCVATKAAVAVCLFIALTFLLLLKLLWLRQLMTLVFALPLKLLSLGLFMTLAAEASVINRPKTTVDICLFMTLVFVLPLKLLWLQKSIYDSGFCVATETAEVAAVYL